MRVAYVSHSLVAKRQELFAAQLAKQVYLEPDGAIYQLYPGVWGNHTRKGGWFVNRPGDNVGFTWPQEAFHDMGQFKPDILLIQQEAYSASARQLLGWARHHNIPYVSFSWENLIQPDSHAVEFLNGAAKCVFGNSDAAQLAVEAGIPESKCEFIPQVGVDPELFTPRRFTDPPPEPKSILFAGRKVPEKGFDVLTEAVNGTDWKVRDARGEHDQGYEAMPAKYRSCIVQAVPSQIIQGRPVEQFAPFCAIEGLMCGQSVVASRLSAIDEWLDGCPAASLVPPSDPEALQGGLRDVIEGPRRWLGMKGRDWAMRFSNEAMAKEWVGVLQSAMK